LVWSKARSAATSSVFPIGDVYHAILSPVNA
jgi:hypothetical protein